MNTIILLGVFLAIQMYIQGSERRQQLSLTNDEKARLLDGTSALHTQQMLPMVILMVILGVFMWTKPEMPALAFGLVLYIIFAAVSSIYTQRVLIQRLSALDLPPQYIQHRKKASLVQNILLMAFFGWLLFSSWRTFRMLDL